MTQRQTRQAGMTLIEVMIAAAILAIVATLVWSGFSQTVRQKQRLQAQFDQYHLGRSALERIARELSMAYLSVHVNPSLSMQAVRTAFVGSDRFDNDRLDFTSFSHRRLRRDAHEGDQNELSYFVADHPEKRGVKVLVRREQPRVDEQPQRGGKLQILVEHVEQFDLQYLDPLSGQWLTRWDTTQAAMQPNRLPVQVKIVMRLLDPALSKKGQTFATRAALPMTYALNHASYNP